MGGRCGTEVSPEYRKYNRKNETNEKCEGNLETRIVIRSECF